MNQPNISNNHIKTAFPRRKWTKEDKDFLITYYEKIPMPELEDRFNCSADAVHAIASRLKITGKRYSVNNYLAGKSYNAVGRKTVSGPKSKRVNPKQVSIVIRGRKSKPKKHRWNDHRLPSKPFTTAGKKLVRIDQKTMIYVPFDATPTEIEERVLNFKNLHRKVT